jgi:hypothetical protein
MVMIREAGRYCWLKGVIKTPISTPLEYGIAIGREPATEEDNNAYGAFLAENPFELPRNSMDWYIPLAVYRLLQLCELTRLDNLLTTGSPTTMLINANIRQSTDSRAPAIMSALGVIEWYRQEIPLKRKKKTKSQDLVCGLYPHEFIQETAKNFGALFTESSAKNVHVSFRNVFLRRESLGTMLPFTKTHGWFSGIAGSPPHTKIDATEHEAVSTREVEMNGSVLIHRAGITMTSVDSPGQPVAGQLRWNVSKRYRRFEMPESYSYSGDNVHGKIIEIAGQKTIYAVALYEYCHVQHGILLQKLRYKMPRTTYLIRIGGYFVDNTPLPPSTTVSWRIL